MRNKVLVLLVVVLAFALRVFGLVKLPVGFTQDEAGIGYEAYSILTTGKDSWGENYPLTLRSFGDFKMPLYSYLAIPSVAIFGLTEFAVRLPNVLMGTLAIAATYLMVSELVKYELRVRALNRKALNRYEINLKYLPLLSALFLAISPWHAPLSRGAFEANLTTFFMPLGVWAFLKGVSSGKKWMLLAALAFGLNLFSYHSARLFTPLIVAILFLLYFKPGDKISVRIRQFIAGYKLASIILIVFGLVAFGSLFVGGGKRGADILISNPTDKWESVSVRRYEAVLQGLPDGFSRLFSNKIVYTTKLFIANYLSYLSPAFLFTQGPGEWGYGMIPGQGVLYFFEIVLLTTLVLHQNKLSGSLNGKFLLLWVVLAFIPTALTKGPGYAANRAAVAMPAIQIISAYGLVVLYSLFTAKFKNRWANAIFMTACVLVMAWSVLVYAEDYVYHEPIYAAGPMQYGVGEIITYAKDVEANYNEVWISRSVSVPQIWVAFYQKWNPSDFQNYSQNWLVYESSGLKYIDQLEGYKLGKYRFGSLDVNYLKHQDKILLIAKPNDLPANVSYAKVVYGPNGLPAYVAISSNSLPN